jgi:hypothetical protein
MTVQPQNLGERCFAIVVLVSALVIFSSFLSSITATITALRQLDARSEGQFWLLRRYLRENHVPLLLAGSINRYLALAVRRQRLKVQAGQIEILQLLSHPLHSRLQKELFTASCHHPFFAAFNLRSGIAMSRMCCQAVRQEHYSQGDIVFNEAEVAQSMVFVCEGLLIYRPDDRCLKEQLKPTQWCSEAVIWIPWQHRGDLISRIETSIICLDAAKFTDVMKDRDDRDNSMPRRYACLFASCLTKLAADGHEISDLHPHVEQLDEVKQLLEMCQKSMSISTFGASSRSIKSSSALTASKSSKREFRDEMGTMTRSTIRRPTLDSTMCPRRCSSTVRS